MNALAEQRIAKDRQQAASTIIGLQPHHRPPQTVPERVVTPPGRTTG